MTSGIYEIKNKINGRRYIGSAANIKVRWMQHVSLLKRNRHDNKHLQHAWDKYSADAFEFNVLELCFPWSLTVRENAWFAKFKPEEKYNMAPTAGSLLGIKRSDETKAKMSAAQKGRGFSSETRAKISASKKGKKASLETRCRMSEVRTGKKMSPLTRVMLALANTGRKLSSEHKAKISAARKGKKQSPETRAKISTFQKGKTVSAETRTRMSVAAKKRREQK